MVITNKDCDFLLRQGCGTTCYREAIRTFFDCGCRSTWQDGYAPAIFRDLDSRTWYESDSLPYGFGNTYSPLGINSHLHGITLPKAFAVALLIQRRQDVQFPHAPSQVCVPHPGREGFAHGEPVLRGV